MNEPIGYLILSEARTFQRAYETACNYALIEVPAEEYPVFECSHIRGMVRASLPGVLTKTHFVNRLGASSSVHDTTPMTPDSFGWARYDFQWRKMIEAGEARNA